MNRATIKKIIMILVTMLFVVGTTSFAFAEEGKGFREIEIDVESSDRIPDEGGLPRMYLSEIPKSYDDTRESYAPELRNQYPFGTCWAFSTVGNAEINLVKNNYAKKNEIDLSEAQIAYFMYHRVGDPLGNTENDKHYLTDADEQENYLDAGGNSILLSYMLSGHVGMVNESEAPYTEARNGKSYDSSLAYSKNSYVMENAYHLDEDNATQIKEAIMKNGAVVAGYYHAGNNNDYRNSLYESYYDDSKTAKQYSNHAIAIVGWDDNFDKSKFIKTPSGNGAWIIRNSWGKDYMGYFYLSYDQNVFDPVSYSFVPASEYSNNYHYDGGSSTSHDPVWQGWSAANIYEVKGNGKGHELLNAVNVGFASADVSYEIEIYTNLTDKTKPKSGTLAATITGTTTYEGLYNIKLDKEVVLTEGTHYSIVVKNKSSDSYYKYFATDRDEYYTDGWYKNDVSEAQWQSFLIEDNGTCNDEYDHASTFRIKGLTKNDDHDTHTSSLMPATLTADGSKAKTECKDCGEVISEGGVIHRIDSTSIKVNDGNYIYNSSAHEPGVIVKDVKGNLLSSTTDYDVSYQNNIDAGTATANITFKGNYSGSTSCTFTILPQELSGYTASLSSTETIYYDGNEKKPAIVVKDAGGTTVPSTSYSVTYSNNTQPGKGLATVTFNDNYQYHGTMTCEFDIICKHENGVDTAKTTPASFESNGKTGAQTCKVCGVEVDSGTIIPKAVAALSPESSTYDGSDKTVQATVKEDGTANAIDKTYYQATVPDNMKDAGTYKVHFKLQGEKYSGETDVDFVISPRDAKENCVISVDADGLVYDGTEKKPKVTVEDGKSSVPSSCYDATYSDNINAGNGIVTIKFKKNYSGELQREFTIGQADGSKLNASAESASYEYTGKKIEPKIKVTDSNTKVISSDNYTVSYENNKEVGTATAKVAFSKNYKGNISCTFKIVCSHPNMKAHTGYAATCLKAGQKDYWTCSASCCKNIYYLKADGSEKTTDVKDLEISKEKHSVTKTAYKAATCCEEGNNEYWTCSKCKGVFKDYAGQTSTTVKDETLAQKAHGMTEHKGFSATCLKTGQKDYWTCSASCCKNIYYLKADGSEKTTDVKDLEISKEKHSVTKTAYKAATCCEEGNNEYWTCSKCKGVFKDYAGQTSTTVKDETLAQKAHGMTEHKGFSATCLKTGQKDYWTCSASCCKNIYYLKEDGSSKTTNVNDLTIPKIKHSLVSHNTPAGYMSDGKSYNECTQCHQTFDETVIPGYSTSYVKGFKVSKGKKCFTAKWKQQSKKNLKLFSGYQIRYSTDPNMRGAVTKNVSKKKTSIKIKKLGKKTRYYVELRTYANGFYSAPVMKTVVTK